MKQIFFRCQQIAKRRKKKEAKKHMTLRFMRVRFFFKEVIVLLWLLNIDKKSKRASINIFWMSRCMLNLVIIAFAILYYLIATRTIFSTTF